MRYTTVLLDFHNTLTNNRARLATSLNEGYRAVVGHNVPAQVVRDALTRDKGETLDEFLRTRSGIPPHRVDVFLRVQSEMMNNIYVPQYSFVIRRLSELGVAVAIVTNSESKLVRQQVQRWGWDKYLAEVFSGGEGGNLKDIARKPYPDRIYFAMQTLGKMGYRVSRENTLMVGDHPVDIEAASSAGVDSAYLITGTEQLASENLPHTQPTYILHEVHGVRKSPNLRDLPTIAIHGGGVEGQRPNRLERW